MPKNVSHARPPLLRALGAADPPVEIVVEGKRYERVEIYKHDSWAATALYSCPENQLVCKFNRTQPILGFPMLWLGKRLADRERWMMRRLIDMPNIPTPFGTVYADGRPLVNAVAHEYIAGHPLGAHEVVDPQFFKNLLNTIREMHKRGIAYVDLHKRENIIVGDDGLPHLIDFQISFDVNHPRIRWIHGIKFIFESLCNGDLYHFQKHIRRCPMTGEIGPGAVIPTWLRFHRLVAVPFRQIRRRLLVARGIRQGRGSVTTEAFAEDAVRREAAARAA